MLSVLRNFVSIIEKYSNIYPSDKIIPTYPYYILEPICSFG